MPVIILIHIVRLAMSKTTKKITDKKEILSKTKEWSLATASSDDDLITWLDEGYEPFAVDQGLIYLKKKGK